MKRLLSLLCAVGLLIGTGCEKVIEFEGEVARPRLTLAAQATVGEPFTAYVASSIFFLNHSYQENAFTSSLDTLHGQVRCFVNGEKNGLVMQLRSEEGGTSLCYTSDYVPAAGDHIRLEAEFPDFDPVWAEVKMPQPPRFELLSVDRQQPDSDRNDAYYAVDLTLAVSDDATYDKYYFLQPLVSYRSDLPWWDDRETILAPLFFTSTDIIFKDVNGTSLVLETLDSESGFAGNFFSDALIKGQRHVFKITVLNVPAPENVGLFGLKLAAVDENLYWYDYSYSQLQDSFGGLFSEAVSLYSNVHGGYGILCASAPMWLAVEW